MVAIDSLLRVMALRDADVMVLAAGEVPSLRRSGVAEPMAMPALDAGLVAGFVEEIVAPEARAELAGRGRGEYLHRAGSGETVAVTIEVNSAGHRLVVRRSGRGAAAPAPRPARGDDAGHARERGRARGSVGMEIASPPPVASPAPATAPSAADPVAATDPVAIAAVTADGDLRGGARAGREVAAALAVPATVPAVPATIRALLDRAAAHGASDLILSEQMAPRVRVDGEVDILDEPAVTPAELAATVAALAGPDSGDALARHGSIDFGATVDGHRLRGHAFRHERGDGLALRLVRDDVPTVERLGLPAEILALTRLRSGLVVVAGPTGAGKSTTLVALVGHLNRTRGLHVVTLEDPIEYLHQPDRCMIHQREIGTHTPSFADGLRAALRETPDVIVLGELRDRATISIALTAAETGHLVLATVHGPGAAVAIDRLIDAFPEHQQRQARVQLAAVLRAVVTQHLVPTRTGRRAVAIEHVVVTPAVAHLIRKHELQLLATHVQTGRDDGQVPLERSLAELVRDGTVDTRVARALAVDHDYFDRALAGTRRSDARC